MSDQLSHSHKKNFESQNVSFTVERLPGSIVRMHGILKSDLINKAIQASTKAVTKEVVVPGFRKGKAPQKFINDNYKEIIEKEINRTLPNLAISEMIPLSGLFPYTKETQVKVTKIKWEKDKEGMIEFEYEVFPDVPKIDLTSIKLPAFDVVEVTPERVEEILSMIRRDKASFEPEDKVIEDGDYCAISLTSECEEHGSVDILADHKIDQEIPGIAPVWNLVKGAKAGDVFDHLDDEVMNALGIPLDNVDDHPHTHKLSIDEVGTITLSALDDDFAKSFGASSIEDLKVKIKERENIFNIEQKFLHQERQIRAYLFEHFPFDIPNSVIKESIEDKWQRYSSANYFEASGDQFLKQKEEFRTGQLAAIRFAFITNELLADAKLELEDAEIDAELKYLVMAEDDIPRVMRLMKDPKALRQELTQKAWNRKVINYILSKVTFE